MDGCGLAPADGENAVAAAKTPFLDGLYEKYPHTTLGASGEDRKSTRLNSSHWW